MTENDFVKLPQIHKSANYFSHGDLLAHFLRDPGIEYRHASYLFQGGKWQRTEWLPLDHSNPARSVLVIGHSDAVITAETVQRVRELCNVRTIFAANLSSDAALMSGVQDIPLGIANRDRSTRTHRIQGNRRVLRRAWLSTRVDPNENFRGVFVNFGPDTNRAIRRPILDLVPRYTHLHAGNFEVSKRARLTDLRNIRFWGMNACPQGHGPDTHRVWETLLMGAYPIVLKHDHVARLLKSLQLPFVGLSNWEELCDAQRLAKDFQTLRRENWNYAPLTATFWISRISGSARSHPSS